MDINQDNEINCICDNKYDIKAFKKHYKECSSIRKRFLNFDTKISLLLKKYNRDEKELNIVIFFFKRYIKLMKILLKKIKAEKINLYENEKIDKNENKAEDSYKIKYIKENEIKNNNENNKPKFYDKDKNEINENKNNDDKKNETKINDDNKIDMNNNENLNNNEFKKTLENEFLLKQHQNIFNEEEKKKYIENGHKRNEENPSSKFYNNELDNDKRFLINYFQGKMKGDDDNPAVLPNYKRISNNEIISKHEQLVEKQIKFFKSWRKDDNKLQNLKIIDLEKYNPLGLNLDLNLEEILVNQLLINNIHENKYIKLKIASKIAIFNYVIFLGEDKNKDVIPISIYDVDKYYSLDIDNWDNTQEFFKIGKYIVIINPNFIIYGSEMYETKGMEGLVCQSPNETILFKDENDLNKFMDLLKANSFDSLKKLGDLMIVRKCYEKSIYYYEKSLNMNNDNLLNKAKILSLLSEDYIQYPYYTKALESINKSFDTYNDYIKINKDKIDHTLIIKLFTRKLRCFIGLRNFKEAYEFFETIKNDKDLHNLYELDESFINKFLNNDETKKLMESIKRGYQNSLGQYNIKEMLNEEKTDFFLNNGDYINKKLEIAFDDKKGIKIIAKENINKGEYIIVEKAIFFCRTHDPNNSFESGIKIQTDFHIISQIEYIDSINNLIKILKKSPLDYKEFFLLYNGENLNQSYEERIKSLPEDLLSKFSVESLEKIFMANKYLTVRNFYFRYKIGFGLWKYLSLFNHSCSPNTTNIGIGDFIIVTANKKIKKGEEITILYLTTPKYYKSRKNLIKNIYNFECDCSLCEIEKQNREEYPEILEKYDEYVTKLINSTEGRERKNIIKNLDSFLEKNKNYLSQNAIGKGYLEMQSYCDDISNATKYYNLANKYLKNRDIECLNLNINHYLQLCKILKDSGNIKSDIYDKAYKDEVDFYRAYFNFKEEETKLFLKVSLINKIDEEILIQSEKNEFDYLKLMYSSKK